MNIKSGKNYVTAFVAVFMLGSLLRNPPRANDGVSYAIAILSSLFGLVIILAFAQLYKRHPGMDFFTILGQKRSFFAAVVLLLLSVYAVFVAAAATREFVGEAVLYALPRTSPFLIAALLAVAALYLATKGAEVMGRLAVLVLVVVALVVAVIIALSAHSYDFSAMLSGERGELLPFTAQILSAFGGIIIPLAVAPNLMRENEGHRDLARGGIIGFFGAAGLIFLAMTHNALVLGANTYAGVRYPTIFTAGLVMAGDFLQRLEALALGLTVPLSMFKMAVCILFVSLSIRTLFMPAEERKRRHIPAVVTAVIATGVGLLLI